MNCYGDFAYIYDRLMKKDINYSRWTDYIENLFHYYDKSPALVGDIACGTGNITLSLSQRGYEMIGVDASGEMLSVAREKASDAGEDILFLQQNMASIDLYGTCGAFLCMIDGINYMVSPKKLLHFFQRLRTCFLDADGIFIFDISTRYKLQTILGSHTFIYNQEDIFYTWENQYHPNHHLCSMYLTFFSRQKNGLYRRFEEVHLQKAYTQKELTWALKQAGFSHVNCYHEQSFDAPRPDSERIVFAALP